MVATAFSLSHSLYTVYGTKQYPPPIQILPPDSQLFSFFFFLFPHIFNFPAGVPEPPPFQPAVSCQNSNNIYHPLDNPGQWVDPGFRVPRGPFPPKKASPLRFSIKKNRVDLFLFLFFLFLLEFILALSRKKSY
ncbi:hypothetical protein I7I53_04323 [Histoplasma capsulatum var. duboisii H88]|uniref:Uncharacterized protein n=1 Tax=Ajellomyces capsulatus (strain H88) TaxID=544711 RepID=A0A8A1LQH1_AJEC8|nr:hypothetical protein I7I53_04323 [Histoplasma capsulatum var. duboisii H88]